MESTSIKIEPILNEIKKEQDCDDHYYNLEQSQEAMGMPIDDVDAKLELIALECKKNFDTKCECIKCICKAEGIDPIGTDYIGDNKVKLEENDFKDLLLNDNAVSISDSLLKLPDCYDEYNNEQKVDISETTVQFVNVSTFGQEYFDSVIKIENQCETNAYDAVLDTQTSRVVQLIQPERPLVYLDHSDKDFNENGYLTTKLAMAVDDGNPEPAKCECKKNDSPTTQKKPKLKTICKIHANSRSQYVCPSCQKSFIAKRSLFSHILANHGDDQDSLKVITFKLHGCPKCNKQFATKYDLDSHILSKHNDEKQLLESISSKSYNCPKCNRQFLHRLIFDGHIMSNHSDDKDLMKLITSKTLDCPKCTKQFIRKACLDRHTRSVHKYDDDLLKMSSGKSYKVKSVNWVPEVSKTIHH